MIKKAVAQCATTILAGALGFEPRTNGFGDHYSTVEPYPYDIDYFNTNLQELSTYFFNKDYFILKLDYII